MKILYIALLLVVIIGAVGLATRRFSHESALSGETVSSTAPVPDASRSTNGSAPTPPAKGPLSGAPLRPLTQGGNGAPDNGPFAGGVGALPFVERLASGTGAVEDTVSPESADSWLKRLVAKPTAPIMTTKSKAM